MKRMLYLWPFAFTALGAEETKAVVEAGPIADLFLVAGSVFIVAAALGVLRFPDFYTRLHSATMLVTLGALGILGAAIIMFGSLQTTQRLLLIIAFFFLTAPLSSYMIARSGYLFGLAPYVEPESVDEWGALGENNVWREEGSGSGPAS